MKPGFRPEQGPDFEDHDALWNLLGESPRLEPDAWFTARALARCRQADLNAKLRPSGFAPFWRWVLGSGLGLGLATVLLVAQLHTPAPEVKSQPNVQEAFEIMASIDTDTDTSSTTWQDSSL